MTMGRCPLSIFCSRGTPPREVPRLRGPSTREHRVSVDVMNENPLRQPTLSLPTNFTNARHVSGSSRETSCRTASKCRLVRCRFTERVILNYYHEHKWTDMWSPLNGYAGASRRAVALLQSPQAVRPGQPLNPKPLLLFFITVKPRVEWYNSLWA